MTRLRRLAWLNAIVHLVGLVLAATVLREPYLHHLPDQVGLPWKLAWGVWLLAGLVLVLLMYTLAKCGANTPVLRQRVAVFLAAFAFGLDAVADLQWIFRYPNDPWMHRTLYAQGAVAANGIYSVAVLLMGLPRLALSLAVFACGVAFSLSAALSWQPGAMVFSGATILLYSWWGLAMARTAPGS